MKSTVQTYQRDKNYARLASALEELAAHAPEGYAQWKELSLAGAAAAKAQDDTGVSKNCKACHNEHRARFRKELRAKKLL
jgi:cytochrome c5